MATFTPPINSRRSPIEPTTKGPAKGLFRHYQGPACGLWNVYILTDGTVVTETPQTLYPTGTGYGVGGYGLGAYGTGITDVQESTSRIARVFYAGHAPEPVTAEEQALLEAAGFAVTP